MIRFTKEVLEQANVRDSNPTLNAGFEPNTNVVSYEWLAERSKSLVHMANENTSCKIAWKHFVKAYGLPVDEKHPDDFYKQSNGA